MIETYSFLWWVYSGIAVSAWGMVYGLSLLGYGHWVFAPFWAEPFNTAEKSAQRKYGS